MKISDNGLKLIKGFEKLRLEAYPDPGTGGEPYTIGYGHTGNVWKGRKITESDAELLLFYDVRIAELTIVIYVRGVLTQNQYDALCSFIFNVGRGNFAGSTLLKKINEKKFSEAAAEFPKWIYAKGQVMPGLVHRRAAERELFEKK